MMPSKISGMVPRAALIGLLLLSSLAMSPAAQANQRCGEIAKIGETGIDLVAVRADGTRCRIARRVLEDQLAATSRGWECHSAGAQAVCTRAGATAEYGPATNTRNCGDVAFERNSENGAFSIVSARVRCRVARSVARGARRHGPTHARRYTKRGFRCTARKVDLGLPAALYTCRRGSRTMAFQRT